MSSLKGKNTALSLLAYCKGLLAHFKALLVYCKGFHFIPFNQAVSEAKQEISLLADDLLLPEFISMVQRISKNFLKTIEYFCKVTIGVLNILGFANFLCITLSLLFILISAFIKWVSHISSIGIMINRIVAQYLYLLASSPYITLLVAISVSCFVFWWVSKYQEKKEKQMMKFTVVRW